MLYNKTGKNNVQKSRLKLSYHEHCQIKGLRAFKAWKFIKSKVKKVTDIPFRKHMGSKFGQSLQVFHRELNCNKNASFI